MILQFCKLRSVKRRNEVRACRKDLAQFYERCPEIGEREAYMLGLCIRFGASRVPEPTTFRGARPRRRFRGNAPRAKFYAERAIAVTSRAPRICCNSPGVTVSDFSSAAAS